MTRRIIVLIGVFVLAGAILYVASRYKPPRNVLPALATAEQVIRLSEMVGELMTVNQAELNRINKEWEKDRKRITHLEASNSALSTKVAYYAAQLENVPIPPVYHPEETEVCADLVDAYVNITAIQNRNIERLKGITDNQVLIIANKDTIIDYQRTYIDEFETLMKQYKKKSTRNSIIGVGLGIAIGLIL
jgi:hypothetical protein